MMTLTAWPSNETESALHALWLAPAIADAMTRHARIDRFIYPSLFRALCSRTPAWFVAVDIEEAA
jgi:hypothetical protein